MTKKPSRDMSGGKPRTIPSVQKVIPLKIEKVELHQVSFDALLQLFEVNFSRFLLDLQAENAWKPLALTSTSNGDAEKVF